MDNKQDLFSLELLIYEEEKFFTLNVEVDLARKDE